jgi:cephalosporin-C deacetylase
MPNLDLPLEELYKYEGRNPKPERFERYWDEALKEVAAVPLGLKLEKTEFRAVKHDCFDLYFDSIKNSKVYCRYIRPKNVGAGEKLPVMLVFHGYGGAGPDSGSFHTNMAWAAQGYIVLAMDCRGQGGYSEDRNAVSGRTHGGLIMRGFSDSDETNMYFRNVFLDTVQIVKAAKSLPNADPDRIYATGASQGGALTVACAALNGRDIKKAAAIYPFLCDYKRVWEMDLAVHAYLDLNEHIRYFNPMCKDMDAFWEKMGLIDIQHLAPRITADIFWSTGLLDDICPPSSQFATYNKIKSKKTMEILPPFKHEWMPLVYDKIMTFFANN